MHASYAAVVIAMTICATALVLNGHPFFAAVMMLGVGGVQMTGKSS